MKHKIRKKGKLNIEYAQEMIGLLRGKGARITKARKGILELILNSDLAMTVPEILKNLDENQIQINKTTVYREIQFLLKSGLVVEMGVNFGVAHYVAAGREHQHRVICRMCGRMKHLKENRQIEESLKNLERSIKKAEFDIKEHKLEFYGVCGRCLR